MSTSSARCSELMLRATVSSCLRRSSAAFKLTPWYFELRQTGRRRDPVQNARRESTRTQLKVTQTLCATRVCVYLWAAGSAHLSAQNKKITHYVIHHLKPLQFTTVPLAAAGAAAAQVAGGRNRDQTSGRLRLIGSVYMRLSVQTRGGPRLMCVTSQRSRLGGNVNSRAPAEAACRSGSLRTCTIRAAPEGTQQVHTSTVVSTTAVTLYYVH